MNYIGRLTVSTGLLISFLTISVAAQMPSATPDKICATLSVSAPDNVNEGSSFFVTATVARGDSKVTPAYNWSISAGTISKGQGTSTIEVTTSGLGAQTVTATLEVSGYDPNCARVASASTYIVKRPEAKKFADFAPYPDETRKAKLDFFAIELQNTPGQQGYIFGYGGRRSRPGTGQKTAQAARDYLVNTRGIDSSTLVTIDGGYKEEVTTELWLVPPGAPPPKASPTVDPKELKVKPATKRSTRKNKSN